MVSSPPAAPRLPVPFHAFSLISLSFPLLPGSFSCHFQLISPRSGQFSLDKHPRPYNLQHFTISGLSSILAGFLLYCDSFPRCLYVLERFLLLSGLFLSGKNHKWHVSVSLFHRLPPSCHFVISSWFLHGFNPFKLFLSRFFNRNSPHYNVLCE